MRAKGMNTGREQDTPSLIMTEREAREEDLHQGEDMRQQHHEQTPHDTKQQQHEADEFAAIHARTTDQEYTEH
jgi:hypothetical protein